MIKTGIVLVAEPFLADPNFVWYHHMSMASDLAASPELIASARETRAHSEGFMIGYLESLIQDGMLAPCDLYLTINLLFGPTQRRSVMSMVLYPYVFLTARASFLRQPATQIEVIWVRA